MSCLVTRFTLLFHSSLPANCTTANKRLKCIPPATKTALYIQIYFHFRLFLCWSNALRFLATCVVLKGTYTQLVKETHWWHHSKQISPLSIDKTAIFRNSTHPFPYYSTILISFLLRNIGGYHRRRNTVRTSLQTQKPCFAIRSGRFSWKSLSRALAATIREEDTGNTEGTEG